MVVEIGGDPGKKRPSEGVVPASSRSHDRVNASRQAGQHGYIVDFDEGPAGHGERGQRNSRDHIV